MKIPVKDRNAVSWTKENDSLIDWFNGIELKYQFESVLSMHDCKDIPVCDELFVFVKNSLGQNDRLNDLIIELMHDAIAEYIFNKG